MTTTPVSVGDRTHEAVTRYLQAHPTSTLSDADRRAARILLQYLPFYGGVSPELRNGEPTVGVLLTEIARWVDAVMQTMENHYAAQRDAQALAADVMAMRRVLGIEPAEPTCTDPDRPTDGHCCGGEE